MKSIPYGHQSINRDDIAAVVAALQAEFLTQGPLVEKFEQKLAQVCGAKYAVVVSSGTAALHVAYFALGLKTGDEFITTPMTFAATANAGLYLNAKPIFVDIKAETGNIDPELIEQAITPQTKLISVVHYGGNPVELKKIAQIAKKHQLKLVEDACHALGASYKGHLIGDGYYSYATVFSFHPVKHITTAEGGAILTNHRHVYEQAKLFRTHGIVKEQKFLQHKNEGPWYMEQQALGFNYRLTDLQCALGLSQLSRLSQFVKRRRQVAKHYQELFQDNPYFDYILPSLDCEPSYHLYPILLKAPLVKKKRAIFEALVKQGLGVQVHYIPVHHHPYYQQLGFSKQSCPLADQFYQREISIPMFYDLSDDEIKKVAKILFSTCHDFSIQK